MARGARIPEVIFPPPVMEDAAFVEGARLEGFVDVGGVTKRPLKESKQPGAGGGILDGLVNVLEKRVCECSVGRKRKKKKEK